MAEGGGFGAEQLVKRLRINFRPLEFGPGIFQRIDGVDRADEIDRKARGGLVAVEGFEGRRGENPARAPRSWSTILAAA
jgi:hypothetical protein